MSRDTKAIIGTVVGTNLVLGVLLSAQIGVVNTRIDDLAASVNGRIDDLRSEVAELRADVRGLDTRLRTVEITLGKVGQRLATLAARGESPASHRDGRRARLTRREEGAYWPYATDERRCQAGCDARRMQRGLLPRAAKAAASARARPGRVAATAG